MVFSEYLFLLIPVKKPAILKIKGLAESFFVFRPQCPEVKRDQSFDAGHGPDA